MNSTTGQEEYDMKDYLRLLPPINHWTWIIGTVFNELAAPFDGFLLNLGKYQYLSYAYTINCAFVLMPALYLTSRYKTTFQTLVSPWGGNALTGILLAQFLWGLVRCGCIVWMIFGKELRRLQRISDVEHAACTKKVLLDYLRARCELSGDEVKAEKDQLAGKDFISKKFHIHRKDGPLASWAQPRGTTAEGMDFLRRKLEKDQDEEFQKEMSIYLGIWGEWC
mmetsp:Transcript_94474/g.211138  ORF Transcript_94474/g.211138 Transcript_94474/m.211138 type:complete len:223 (+) Transcript_94474:1-669(+)